MYFGKGGALLKLDRTSMLYGTLLLTATGLVNLSLIHISEPTRPY